MSEEIQGNKKDSFILYTANKEFINILSDEDAGKLFKSIFDYVSTGKEPQFEDKPKAMMAFLFIKQQLDINAEKYTKKCEVNRLNGLKGGRPKKEYQEKPKKANGFLKNPTKPKKADNDNDNDNESVYVNEIDKSKNKKQLSQATTTQKNYIEEFLNDNLNFNRYGVYQNVILSKEHKTQLFNIIGYPEEINRYINELSTNIASNQDKPFDTRYPDMHKIRIEKYFKNDKNRVEEKWDIFDNPIATDNNYNPYL